MAKPIGIDLGTTNSVVAVMEGDQPKVLVNAQGSRLTASVVGFTDKGEILVGQPAKHQQVTNPKNTVFSIKRFMGRRHSEVAQEEKMVPYEVTGGAEEYVKVKVRGKEYTPEQVSAMILGDLKKTAESYLGETVKDAVITVPAYFNDAQRKATKDAGEIAGLNVIRVLPEPTAAALAFGLDKTAKNQKICVFDLGGGTFDVSVLDVGDGVFEVLSINGDTHLGGDDFDEELINYLAEEFRKQEGIDLRKDPMALQRLKEASEKAKIELSTAMETTVNLPFITADASGPKHLQTTVTRAKFEQLIGNLVERCRKPVVSALKDAGVQPEQIGEVVLVGGSTRVPMVAKLVKELFKKEPNRSVNPDEVVALGAAVQASIATGQMKDILVLDATPLSLGVETQGNVMTPLIARNTTIPAEKKEIFSTASDGQTAVTINVLQGEREFAKDNRLLGRFNLEGIAPAPRGVPQIEVTFKVDVNGILTVSAKDLGTGKENNITVQNAGGLEKDEIERMKREAEAHADEDKKRREVVDLKNRGDALVYETEKSMREHGEKVTPEIRGEIESALNNLKDALKSEDGDRVKKSIETVQQATMKMGQSVYGNTAGGQGAAPEAASNRATGDANAKKDEDVIDAEYEVKE